MIIDYYNTNIFFQPKAQNNYEFRVFTSTILFVKYVFNHFKHKTILSGVAVDSEAYRIYLIKYCT